MSSIEEWLRTLTEGKRSPDPGLVPGQTIQGAGSASAGRLEEWLRTLTEGKRIPDLGLAPRQTSRGVGPASAARYAFSLVACARWEEANIQEWVEYHKSIGFNHVYLYSNDDDPAALFRAVASYSYGPDPFITFLHWPRVGEQIEIYLHFLNTFKHETTWYSLLDIDEFFVLKGVDNIARFMRNREAHVDCLYFNWLNYGNSGKVRREDGPTLTSYLRRDIGPDSHTKMLCRSAAIDVAAVAHGVRTGLGAFYHFLDNYKLPGVRCRDVLGDSTEGYSASFPDSARSFATRPGFAEAVMQQAYIAHFQFRSEDDFIRRWRRGGHDQDEMWRAMYETGVHRATLAPRNRVYDTYLAEYWHRYTANAMRVGAAGPDPAPPEQNVALNKPSWQSSVYLPEGDAEPASSRCAGGGNNGVRTGTYGFHTDREIRPWWIVDLLRPHRIAAIHIYNRRDNPVVGAQANELDVLASTAGVTWYTLWSNPAQTSFGLDGTPLVVTPPSYFECRFVLLRLRGSGCLHMDEIEVYGSATQQSTPVEPPEGGPIIPCE
jgi:hypothetical protein